MIDPGSIRTVPGSTVTTSSTGSPTIVIVELNQALALIGQVFAPCLIRIAGMSSKNPANGSRPNGQAIADAATPQMTATAASFRPARIANQKRNARPRATPAARRIRPFSEKRNQNGNRMRGSGSSARGSFLSLAVAALTPRTVPAVAPVRCSDLVYA